MPELVVSGIPEAQRARALFLFQILQPLLSTAPGSKARSAAVRNAAESSYLDASGKSKSFTAQRLYQLLKAYESGGIHALIRKPRADKANKRSLISTAWDKAYAEHDNAEFVAEALQRYIRSLQAEAAPGWRDGCALASSKLYELTERLIGSADKSACRVPRHLFDTERSYQMLATKKRDAKAYYDNHLPRIRRSREQMQPNDIWVGDVTPLDFYLDRQDPDGKTRQATARAICWLDVATNRIYASLHLAEKGKGVTRLEVAASFAACVRAWGLPRKLYLDNGGEYSWAEMLEGFATLSHLAHPIHVDFTCLNDFRRVIRAQPYNSAAKPIEGIFSALQHIYRLHDRWLGGDRQRKKSANLGNKALSVSGGFDELHDWVENAIELYHQKPQFGQLDGLSPYATLQQHLEQGWGKVDVNPDALLLAFADKSIRRVDRGYIQYAPPGQHSIYYYHDALLPITGKVEIRVPRHDPSRCFCLLGGKVLCVAMPDHAYGFNDPAGAEEARRRQGVLARWLSLQKRNTDRLVMKRELERHLQHLPPAPLIPTHSSIGLDGQLGAMIEADNAALEQRLALRGQRRQLSQFGVAEDPEVAAFRFMYNSEEDDHARIG